MKRCLIIIMIGALSLVLANDIYSQISYGGTPYSFTETLLKKSRSTESNTVRIEDLNMGIVNKELEILNSCKDCNTGFYYGKEVNVNVDFFEYATMYDYSEEENIWILKFESDEAKGYQFIFDEFYLPFGSKLFIYNEDKTMLLGAFTSENNRENRTFLTQYINGKNIYLEYVQPKNDTESNKISIKKVVYIFNECFLSQKGPFSDDKDGAVKCHINTSCPEGKGLDIEIKSTVMILGKNPADGFFGEYWGTCTGVLINDGLNYSSKKNPYILTANHCYENMGKGTFNDTYNWLFLFRHEAPGCSSDGSDVKRDLTKSVLGGRVLVRDEESKNSDYLLLELSNTVNDIAKFDITFAGYDLNSYSVEPGNFLSPIVNIHHPKGDIKKLTISSEPASSVGVELIDGGRLFNIIDGNTHWEVKATKGFKTEGGSSGSPLFDSNHRVIGICRGSSDDITCASNRDLYKTIFGKLSMAPEVTPLIFAYLKGNQSDPYTPVVSEKSYTEIVHYRSNMVPNHESPEIYCTIKTNVGNSNQKITVECIVNRFSNDATKYEYVSENDPRYFLHKEEISLTSVAGSGGKNLTASINFKLPVFRNNGTHRLEINVYRGVQSLNANYTGYLLVSDGDCNCAKVKLELVNPQEKYASGSSIKIKESSTVENLPYALEPHNSYSCYKDYPFCSRPGKYRWQPRFVGIGQREWLLNGKTESLDKYTTANEYVSTNPGKYYVPSERTFKDLSPGVHYIGVKLEMARDYGSQKPPIGEGENKCMSPYAGYTFNPYTIGGSSDSQSSGYARVVIADCNGIKTINNPDDPLMLPSPTDKKLVGAGSITIENVSMDKYKVYDVDAYKSIILKPGVHIKAGTTFRARITPCPPTTRSAIMETKSTPANIEVSDNIADKIAISPNPTNGIVTPKTRGEGITIEAVDVYNMNGQLVRNRNSIVNPYAFDLSGLPNGIYILKINSSLGISNHKIILKK